ncbi:MAG: iron-containing alcohol dehydrogenase [Bacteroidales bacterium]|jgi:butanol dehydrogenase|nr:iron-containing alcohol dehydrogenase [Bacteroidales bacterium]MDD2204864.1 iron-containing alcohol dehydrogenase [Bacteroidales bacterium]MDD3152236.1 iron-containing alcohol dehydrogenase [Bacteroidales bacterium]MDD3913520.1 iron-containing alcohol dehydrogenase [Bacteroidales bacterium]MDD4634169.1 iron-containing alcohol dehydrogenase [Bacteroidales bacterium]
MNSFIYDIPVKVCFGENQLQHLGKELNRFGKRILLTYGGGSIKKTGLYDKVITELNNSGLEIFELSGIEPNPRIDSVRKGAQMCKDHKIDVLLAVGGGSTIDATKFMAAGACVDFDPWNFLNEQWAPIEKALPIVTILTLSATGSEMDCGGVISNPETNDKIGRMAPPMLPKVSFLDPTNTFTVSPYQTACGSSDILSHIIEVYFNMSTDLYMLDCFMEGLMKTVIKYTPIAMKEPDNYEARANLMWTSSWAINGFIDGGKTQAWSCHPMEHELSAFYDITHGLGLAILTPRWMEYCLNEKTVSKYVQFGVNVFGISPNQEPMTIAKQAITAFSDFLFKTLGLKNNLTSLNIDNTHFETMAEKSVKLGGLKYAFIPLDKNDVMRIFEMCLL